MIVDPTLCAECRPIHGMFVMYRKPCCRLCPKCEDMVAIGRSEEHAQYCKGDIMKQTR